MAASAPASSGHFDVYHTLLPQARSPRHAPARAHAHTPMHPPCPLHPLVHPSPTSALQSQYILARWHSAVAGVYPAAQHHGCISTCLKWSLRGIPHTSPTSIPALSQACPCKCACSHSHAPTLSTASTGAPFSNSSLAIASDPTRRAKCSGWFPPCSTAPWMYQHLPQVATSLYTTHFSPKQPFALPGMPLLVHVLTLPCTHLAHCIHWCTLLQQHLCSLNISSTGIV